MLRLFILINIYIISLCNIIQTNNTIKNIKKNNKYHNKLINILRQECNLITYDYINKLNIKDFIIDNNKNIIIYKNNK